MFLLRLFGSVLFGFVLFLVAPSGVEAEFEVNELGRIPVLEYHRIVEAADQYARSPQQFRQDLEWLYNNGYYLISVSNFVDQYFDVPKGKKPVIITFDDADSSQFLLRQAQDDKRQAQDDKVEGNTFSFQIDPDCAIGILDVFLRNHPDFGKGEMFFVNPRLFDQPESRKQKLDYLISTGRELGNHTANHANLHSLSADDIRDELGILQQYVNKTHGKDVPLGALAYPFGGVPKDEERIQALQNGEYQNTSYRIEIAFLVGADPAYPPYHKEYEALYVQRIQAIDDEWQRWFGRSPGQTEFSDSEVFYPFVSDGDPEVVTVISRSAHLVNKSALKSTLRMCVRDQEECVYTISSGGNVGSPLPVLSQTYGSISDSGDAAVLEQPSNIQHQDDQAVVIRGNLFKGLSGMILFVEDSFSAISYSNFVHQVREIFSIPKVRVGFNVLPEGLKWDGAGWVYMLQAGDSISLISQRLWKATSYWSADELEDELIVLNKIEGDSLEVRSVLNIPNVESWYVDIIPLVSQKQGIYWTGYTSGSRRAREQADLLVKSGGNSVVFDVKEVEGKVYYPTKIKAINDIGALSVRIPDVSKFVRNLHSKGLHVIARLTLFKDEALANARKDLTIKDARSGQPWSNREGLVWVDPSNPEVVAYNLALLREVVSYGVDEVQFDYIRFPALGADTESVKYWYQQHNKDWTREQVIVDFLRQARAAVSDYEVELSADVFGIVAWNDGIDGKIVGQDIKGMVEYLDAIYPMVYPSHFGSGFANRPDPANDAYFFVKKSTEKFLKLVEGTGTEVRPWIQGFRLGVNNFGTGYIREQIKAVHDAGADDFMIWNAANDYEYAWKAF